MPVDHAEVLRRLKAYIASKPSHGQRDLLACIGRLEAVCGVEDETYQRFLGRFAGELEEAFLNIVPPTGEDATTRASRPLTGAAASAPAMEEQARPSTGAERATEEDTCRSRQRRSESAKSALAVS